MAAKGRRSKASDKHRRKLTPDELRVAEQAHPEANRAHFEDVMRRLVTTKPPSKRP